MTTRMNLRVLAVFAIVSLPLLVVAGSLAMGAGRSELRESNGRQLAQIAELIASGTDAYVYRRIIAASVLARVPTLREAAATAGRGTHNEALTRELDETWQSGSVLPAALAGVLTNAASRFLVDVTTQDPIYREVLLTDQFGRLTAASGRTTDYFQADEEWWKEAFGDGVGGRMFVSGVTYDESAQSDAIQIALPVTAAADNSVIGVLKVIADIRELTALVSGMRVGTTGDARLVRPNGSLVLSRAAATDPTVRFFAADVLRQRLDTLQEGQGPVYRLHFSARASDGESRLIGIASSQIGTSYQNLDWLVAVSQAESELFGPVNAQVRWLLLMLTLAALIMFVLALLFSSWLAAPPIPEDMHLSTHPAVRRIDEPN